MLIYLQQSTPRHDSYHLSDHGIGGATPTPYEGWGRGWIPWKPNSRAMSQGLDQRSKWKKLCQRWRAGEAQMQDNLGPRRSSSQAATIFKHDLLDDFKLQRIFIVW